MKQLIVGSKVHGDSMFVRGRQQEKNSGEEQRKRSKSRNSNKIYNYCKRKGSHQERVFQVVEQGKEIQEQTRKEIWKI